MDGLMNDGGGMKESDAKRRKKERDGHWSFSKWDPAGPGLGG
jgi:hypothetical protein